MPRPSSLIRLPERLAVGSYVLHSGWTKWGGTPERAQGVHGMAAAAYPFLGRIAPTRFLRLLAAAEIATGLALLVPFVPRVLAGALLSGFSAGLVGMYLRTPAMRAPGSVWPSQQGTAVSKDVWMLGIGTSLVLDAFLNPAG